MVGYCSSSIGYRSFWWCLLFYS